MSRNEINKALSEIFRDVFDDENIELSDTTTADDVDDWDSLSQITLIGEIESAFSLKFSIKDISALKNVGEMVDLLVNKKGAAV